MKTSVIPLPTPYRCQIIEDDRDYINALLDNVWNIAKDTIEINGFRKGEAPRTIAEKKLGVENLYKPALNQILEKGVKEAKLQVCEVKDVVVQWFTEKEPLQLFCIFILMPVVTNSDYKNLSVAHESLTVTEEEIANNLNRLAFSEADETPQEIADESSLVTLDVSIVKKDTSDLVGTQNDIQVKPGNAEIYGFEKSLIGKKNNEIYEFGVKLSDTFFAESLRNTEVIFKITVKKVVSLKIPEINDDLAKKIGFDSLQEMKDGIVKDLQKDKERASEIMYRDSVTNKLLAKTETTPIPDVLVKKELDTILANEVEQFSKQTKQKVTEEQYLSKVGVSKEQWTNINWVRAVKKIKLGLLLNYVIEKEGISVTDEECETELAVILPKSASNVQIDKVAFKEYITKKKAQDYLIALVDKKG